MYQSDVTRSRDEERKIRGGKEIYQSDTSWVERERKKRGGGKDER